MTDHVDGIFKALCTLKARRIQECERSHVLFGTKNDADSAGRVKITQDDVLFHSDALLEVMKKLDGVQPAASVYSKSLHKFDQASTFRLSQVQAHFKDPRTLESPWSMFEGQVLHDLVSYVHRLHRAHEQSRNPTLQALKHLCPSQPKTQGATQNHARQPPG